MAFVYADRVKEQSNSTGLSSMTLVGAASNFQTFLAGIGVSNQSYYTIVNDVDNTWEVGIGTLSGVTTFTRDTVLSSSNAGALVDFAAGSKTIFGTVASEFFAATLDTASHGSINHAGLPGVPPAETFTQGNHALVDHTALPFGLLNDGAHDGINHTLAPFNLLTTGLHNGLDHAGIPGVNSFDLSTHAGTNHSSVLGVPAPESFTASDHNLVDHTLIPFSLLDTAAHANINHKGVPGVAAYSGVLHYGGDWQGGVNPFMQANGVADQTSLGSPDERTQIRMPRAGEIVAVTWNAFDLSTTRVMEVLVNGVAVITFTLNAVRLIIPGSPPVFAASDDITVRGDQALGAGNPFREVVHVFVLDTGP